MNQIKFDYQSALVDTKKIASIGLQLEPEIARIQGALHSYDTDYASVHLPFDADMVHAVNALVARKKQLQPRVLIVIGIGGSNLGTLAVQQALYGTMYNQELPDMKVYYADTVDSDHINDIFLLVQQALEKEETVLINLISKSGTTTESIANFDIFCQLLKSFYSDEYNNYVIVTSQQGSPLHAYAQEQKFDFLPIPQKVGGRFSVFSQVGLFPMALMGIDIHALLKGARELIEQQTVPDIFKNGPALHAALLFAHYQKKIEIHNLFLFSVDLESIGSWNRQLMAESLGKDTTRTGQKKHVGILPIVSVGSTDLHSMAQLYLAGPNSMFTTFVTVEKNTSDLQLSADRELEKLVPHIKGKSLKAIMQSIFAGITHAYQKNQMPFALLQLPEKNAYAIGQLLQWNMLEIMYLGFLLDINPFDQPNVEVYKNETRKILAHE